MNVRESQTHGSVPDKPAGSSSFEVNPGSEAREPGIAELVSNWTEAASQRVKASVQLVMAETRLAVTTVIVMIFLVTLAAGALMFAWALALFALVQALSLAGASLLAASGGLALLHAALAFGFWRLANHLGRHVEFAATRQLLGS